MASRPEHDGDEGHEDHPTEEQENQRGASALLRRGRVAAGRVDPGSFVLSRGLL
jgi:hypothetical protein